MESQFFSLVPQTVNLTLIMLITIRCDTLVGEKQYTIKQVNDRKYLPSINLTELLFIKSNLLKTRLKKTHC